MGTGLTFAEYVELKLKPHSNADQAFHEAADAEQEDMFPMSLATAAHHLRSRGYDCKPTMLELLTENGVVTPNDPDVWTQKDVDTAAATGVVRIPGPAGFGSAQTTRTISGVTG